MNKFEGSTQLYSLKIALPLILFVTLCFLYFLNKISVNFKMSFKKWIQTDLKEETNPVRPREELRGQKTPPPPPPPAPCPVAEWLTEQTPKDGLTRTEKPWAAPSPCPTWLSWGPHCAHGCSPTQTQLHVFKEMEIIPSLWPRPRQN